MSQFETPNTAIASLRATVQSILSRLNKISTADGKIRSDGAGSTQTGVSKIHDHTGTGEGGSLLDGNVPLWLNVGNRAPTVNDDTTQGYQRGSQWINSITSALYVCLRADTGAAEWKVATTINTTFSLPVRRPRATFEEAVWIRPRRRFIIYS